MHNLHIVVVRAGTAEDAVNEVEGAIEDWGGENNWRCVFAAIGEDGSVHETDADALGEPTTWTLEALNEELRKAVQLPEMDAELNELLARLAKGRYDGLECTRDPGGQREACTNIHDIKELVDHLLDLQVAGLLGPGREALRQGPLSVFGTEFRRWELDRFGVTHLFGPECGNEEDDPLFAVLVDMHS